MKVNWRKIMLTPLQLFYWNIFYIILNMGLVIYVPYKYFFFESFPDVKQTEVIITIVLVVLQVMEILGKLQTSSDMLGSNLQNKPFFPFDLISLFAIISISFPDDWTPAIRLLIYFKLPSILKYDRHITIVIQSQFFNFWYILIKVIFLYLVYCNFTAGLFFKVDFHLYLTNQYYVEENMLWLLNSGVMKDILSWSAPVHYVFSIYWSVITASCTGYGDLTPRNPQQVLITLFAFVPNVLLFGFMIDNINFRFSQLKQRQQMIEQQQTVMLRVLRDAHVSSQTYQQFKFHISKLVDLQIDNRQNIMQQLSSNLQMQLIKQIYKKSLQKFNDLNTEDLLTIRSHINEITFFQNQIIFPGNSYYYVVQGYGKVFMKGLDYCSYEESTTQIYNFSPKSSLNLWSFFTRSLNPFISYRTQKYTRFYTISTPPNILSLRLKSKQIMVDKKHSKYGIQCQICFLSSHPTSHCYYFSFITSYHFYQTPNLNNFLKSRQNKRQYQERHNRQNELIRNLDEFKFIKFQQCYSQLNIL